MEAGRTGSSTFPSVTLNLLIDMNLSPDWVPLLVSHGLNAIHCSRVGDPRASDEEIMEWAANHDYIVFTHDLDFSAMLPHSHANGPSVLQVRAADVSPHRLGNAVLAALEQHGEVLSSGALVVVDERRSRVRLLPIVY